jgi:hypothetical protein
MLYTDLLSEYNHIRGDKSNGRDFPPSIEADVAGVGAAFCRGGYVTAGSHPTTVTTT